MENKVVKATIWYTLSSILVKGMGFLTTPFFSRILTQDEYGLISNYSSWCSLLATITTLCMASTLVRARFDYQDTFDQYVKSTLVLGESITIGSFCIIFCNLSFFSGLFSLDKKYIFLIFAHCMVTPAYDYFLLQKRFEYNYRLVVALSLIMTIGSTLLSFLLIFLMNDNMLARVLGLFLPQFILGCWLLVRYLVNRTKIATEYWKYALAIAVPYVFHLLGSLILHTSDKAVITKLCGPVDNALYSMAYNIAMIVNVFIQSLNNAFSPWLGEMINERKYMSVKKYSYGMILLFMLGLIGVMLVAPDILFILGGEKYSNAKFVVPPVMMGYFFMFIQTLYADVEQFEKKTMGMAIATSIAAALNLGANILLIPLFGYIAAAYTTMASFAMMSFFHYIILKKIQLDGLYGNKSIFLCEVVLFLVMLSVLWLYENNTIRYIVVIGYIIFSALIIFTNKNTILRLFKQHK